MTDEPLTYGPDMFASDVSLPDPATVLNEPLPRAWTQGGMIEAVKRAVITGLRSSFGNSSLTGGDQKFYIDIEYPTEPTSYPGIWVQFSIANLSRAGLSMETWTKDDDGNWGSIQEWSFNGNITLTVAALTSKDRDRLSDTVIAQLAFARPPDLIIYNPKTNANQMKGLITALDQNPYVSMTVNTDVIQSGGETVTGGTPWAQNILLYENNFSLTCHGQFNLRFSHDGVYSLAEIRHNHVLTDEIPPDNSHDPNRPPRDPRWV
jgi:hypothetical protein